MHRGHRRAAYFPGNVIPPNRIKSNGKALLNMLPRANNFDRTFTQGQFNYTTQENADNPKMNNVVRVDWKPSVHDSLYFTFKDWYSDRRGREITPVGEVGILQYHYLNTIVAAARTTRRSQPDDGPRK